MKTFVFLLYASLAFSLQKTEAFIFPLQEKHVHGSSIVECPNGDLLACWFYGSGERRASDVLVQGSRLKKGETNWSPVFLLADTPNLPDCNPVFFIDREKKLWLFWIAVQAEGWQHSVLKYRYSTDYQHDGAPIWTWQDVILLQPGEHFTAAIQSAFQALGPFSDMWAEYAAPYSQQIIIASKDKIKRQTGWMTRIHPLELPSGRILLPLYSDGFNVGLCAISDDAGQTWSASGPMVGYAPIQPALVRKSNGGIVSYMRDSGDAHRVLRSESTDDGETWSPALATDIPNPGSSLEVLALHDGRWILLYNDTKDGRHSLALALSEDEGVTWPWKRHLERHPNGHGSYAYPSVVQGNDGRLFMTYSYHVPEGRTIKYVSMDVDWIKN
ncbi:exo-alpha-sialidase [candidate division KSB1 bacterium]|nr:exo-alpha-sialidase [candidate division KSB1 bacterium]RQW05881.1 MAG: exo-alpha-sialidase [candidate division KSB1 bacterium]